MNSPHDGSIIDAVLAGQSERFSELVRQYERALFRVAISRLNDQQRAQDAVQETFLSAFKSLHTYDPKFSFRTWLWTILINQCRRQLRRSKRDQREISTAEFDDRQADDFNGPENAAIFNEQSARLEFVIAGLPETQADAIRLRFYGGLSFPEIAGVMDVCLTSAKNYVRRGLISMSSQVADLSTIADVDAGSDSNQIHQTGDQ